MSPPLAPLTFTPVGRTKDLRKNEPGTPPVRRAWPGWRRGLTGLSALALALCAYLSWHYLAGNAVIGCGGRSPCERVLSSRWSSVGGVLPVSGLAAGAYLAILVATLFLGPETEPPVRRLAWGAILLLAGAAAGSAVWFIIVQEWVVGAFCPYCMATHLTGLLLAALVIGQAFRRGDAESTVMAPAKTSPHATTGAAPRFVNGPLPAVGLLLAGVALAGILAVCQAALTPPAAYRGGESRNRLPALDPHAVPLVGSPNAPYVVTLIFDYKCPHCQQLYFMLDEAVRRYAGKLAFLLCPAPLNTHCNPYVPRDVPEFADSCELAKVGLAVWAARREAFPAFDRWMFSFESGDRWHPRSLAAARAKAVALVGQAQFNAALANPWVEAYLQDSIRLYGNTLQAGQGGVPKLVFGSHWVIPEPNNADDLVAILHQSLALPKP